MEENTDVSITKQKPKSLEDDPLMLKLNKSIERQICLEIFSRLDMKALQSQQHTLSDFVPSSVDLEQVRLKYISNSLAQCVLNLQKRPKEEVVSIATDLVRNKANNPLGFEELPQYYTFYENIFHKGETERSTLEEEMLSTLILANQVLKEQADKRREERRKQGADSSDLDSLKADHKQLVDYITSANEKIKWDTTWYSAGGALLGFLFGTSIAALQHWKDVKNASRGTAVSNSSQQSNDKHEDLEKRWAGLKKQKDLIKDLRKRISELRTAGTKPKSG
jgi:hypothetical protein